ncbi:MAG: insulinase family protein, partial [Bdellovibrionales bacterium]|nr:insulinase family protein [Bdellovibrionales bacterium]
MSCSLPNFRLLLSPFGFSLFNSFCFCLSLLNLLYPLGEFAYGNPRTEKAFEIEHHIVNGFDVFLVDNRYGNEVTLAVHVPTGSYHDDPLLHAGRAHLWEHVIHNGSKGFPGSNTFHNLSSRMGARTNAFTSENRTFYYLSFHPDALKEAAQLQGDMFSQPEWKEDAFQKEKLNVMDEAKQYQSYSARILQSSIWLNLLPAGHPWSMYNVGTQVQLEKMRLADLQELYFSSYVPRSMSIIVAGNFTESADGKELLSKEKVLEFIRTYYHPPSVPDSFKSLVAGKDIVFPDISDGMGPKFIELGSSKQNEHLLLLNFQIPTDFASQNFIAIETMNDYLNSNGPGSLSDHLKSQGLLVSTGAHFSKTNNIWREFLWLELTPKGAENRYRVVEQIFSYLASLSKNGISQEYLEFLIKRNIFSYQEQLRNPVEATKL